MGEPLIEALLVERIGLNPASVGAHSLQLAVAERMRATGAADEHGYAARLAQDPAELQALVEQLVVPETWFFRDVEPFRHLETWARQKRLTRPLRLLSLPASTGEEAYSIAMTLTDLGLAPGQFVVDGVDISERAVERARRGRYRHYSFRGEDTGQRARYFTAVGDEFEIIAPLRSAVRFLVGNVLDPWLLMGEAPYDVIFFRNLLIYLHQAARQKAVSALHRLLAPDGTLYLGHADSLESLGTRFRPLPDAGAFAFRRLDTRAARAAEASKRARATPVQARPAVVEPPAPPPQSLLQQAAALADGGRLAAAAEVCERHLRDRGPDAAGYSLMGVIRMAEQRPDDAELCFRKALYLDHGHYESLVHLAALCDRRGDQTGAANLRRRAERSAAARAT